MMDNPKPPALKPLICTFRELLRAFFPLHMNNEADVMRLHDIWKMGAPTPDSRILKPKEFDERIYQPGNHVRRIVFPTPLAQWVKEIANRRGLPLNDEQALKVVLGEQPSYEVPKNPRIIKP